MVAERLGVVLYFPVNLRSLYPHASGALRESEVIANYRNKIRELEKCCHNQMLLALEFEKV